MFTGLLVNEISVRSRVISADALGGQAVSNTTIYSNRLARVNSLSAEQQYKLLRSGITATHRFFCEPDMTIVAENEIISDGVTYRVTKVIGANDAGGLPHHWTVYTTTPQ